MGDIRFNECQINGCLTKLGPGAANVGFHNWDTDKIEHIKICSGHAWQIMVSPRGSLRITPDRKIELIPARPTIIP